MKPEPKVWGTTTELYRGCHTSTHYLDIVKGGYCSIHRHVMKRNIFYVIEGVLELSYWIDDITTGKNFRILTAGEYFNEIIPGVWHQFRALSPVKCIEICDYTYDENDIERRTEGGRDEQ